jgi:carbonic anhydrase
MKMKPRLQTGFQPVLQSVHRIVWLAVLLAPAALAVSANAQTGAPPPWGNNQSPIDIRLSQQAAVPVFTNTGDLANPTPFTLRNTTGTNWCKDNKACQGTVDQRWGSLKAYAPEEGSPDGHAPEITFGGVVYGLKEFHFHYPAEHLLNGKLAPMEIHFVFHRHGVSDCSANEYVVVGQLIEQGAENAELQKIFGPDVKLPGPGESQPIGNVTVGRILVGFPAKTMSYRYAGSLTAPTEIPACGIPPSGPNVPNQLGTGYLPEVVSWVLLTHPLTMSPAQIARFEKLFPNGDARAPQKLNQRVMTGRDGPPIH